jgi:hypothetical protein
MLAFRAGAAETVRRSCAPVKIEARLATRLLDTRLTVLTAVVAAAEAQAVATIAGRIAGVLRRMWVDRDGAD